MPHRRDRLSRLQGRAARAHDAATRSHPRAAGAHGGAPRPPTGCAARRLGARAAGRVRDPGRGEGRRGGRVTETVTTASGAIEAGRPSPLTVRLEEFEGPLDLLL